MENTQVELPALQAGVGFTTVNYRDMFMKLKVPAIFVNDLDTRYPEHKELLDRYLMTNYETATFTMIPSCDCGHLVGGYLRGKKCPICDSRVLAHTERPIEANLWLRVPDGVKAFISPIVYNKLSQAFETNKIDVIRWVCDIHYKANFDTCEVIQILKERGVKRGYNYFIENFWTIIDILLEKRIYTSVSDKRKDIKEWLLNHKDDLFTEYLPLPNRVALVTEKTPTGRFSEIVKFGSAIEAARAMSSLNERLEPPSAAVKENIAFRCVMLLARFNLLQYKHSLGKKTGFIRKHICGTRMVFTARNVITSLHENHDYRELHVPWAMAIGLLRLHLINKFLRDGYTPNEAQDILVSNVNRHHPLLRRYFNELLNECPYMGLPCIFNRNPTLLRSSIQQFFITKIKDNPNDDTISVSVLCLSGFNADASLTNYYFSTNKITIM